MVSDPKPRAIERDQPIIDLAQFGAEVLRRRAATGDREMPRNSGERRTASKRALLKAIEEAGGRW